MGSRVEFFAVIRRDARVEDLSIRELAERHHVHQRTVRQTLASAFPPLRKTPVRVSRKLEPFRKTIDGWLRDDLNAPKSNDIQRRGCSTGSSTNTTPRTSRTRPCGTTWQGAARRSAAAAGRGLEQGFVPQTHEPGGEAEIGFADLWVMLRGVRTKTFLFTLRPSYSGKSVHRVFATQGREAFLEGHVPAFTKLGGTRSTRSVTTT